MTKFINTNCNILIKKWLNRKVLIIVLNLEPFFLLNNLFGLMLRKELITPLFHVSCR